MIIHFKYGIIHEGMTFGWYKKELYRLPGFLKKTITFKKLNQIMIGNKVGYRLRGDKFTLEHLQTMTIFIDKKIQIIKDKSTPF